MARYVLHLPCVLLLLLVAVNVDGKTLYYDDLMVPKGIRNCLNGLNWKL